MLLPLSSAEIHYHHLSPHSFPLQYTLGTRIQHLGGACFWTSGLPMSHYGSFTADLKSIANIACKQKCPREEASLSLGLRSFFLL